MSALSSSSSWSSNSSSSLHFPQWRVTPRYSCVRQLGKGSYGEVVMAIDKRFSMSSSSMSSSYSDSNTTSSSGSLHQQTSVAIKKMNKIFYESKDSACAFREMHILRQLRHPCIVKLTDVFCSAYPSPQLIPRSPEEIRRTTPVLSAVKEVGDLYLAFEFVETDLKKFLQRNTAISIENIKSIMVQILSGLHYAHSARVIHRDLKPANILIDTRDASANGGLFTAKIADFGLSRVGQDFNFTAADSDLLSQSDGEQDNNNYNNNSSSSNNNNNNNNYNNNNDNINNNNINNNNREHHPEDDSRPNTKKSRFSTDKFSDDNVNSITNVANIESLTATSSFAIAAAFPSPLQKQNVIHVQPISSSKSSPGRLTIEENHELIHPLESSSLMQVNYPSSEEKTKTGNSLFDFLGVFGDDLQPPLLESDPIPTLKRQLSHHVVTRHYRAPEVILAQPYGSPIDIWSLGCIFAELLCVQAGNDIHGGKTLFPGGSQGDLSRDRETNKPGQLTVILSILGNDRCRDLKGFSSNAVDPINRILTNSYFRGLEFSDRYRSTPAEGIDLLLKMLAFNPSSRITVDEALRHPFLASQRRPELEVKSVTPLDAVSADEFETPGNILHNVIRELSFYNAR